MMRLKFVSKLDLELFAHCPVVIKHRIGYNIVYLRKAPSITWENSRA
jgi:hypothetical protein